MFARATISRASSWHVWRTSDGCRSCRPPRSGITWWPMRELHSTWWPTRELCRSPTDRVQHRLVTNARTTLHLVGTTQPGDQRENYAAQSGITRWPTSFQYSRVINTRTLWVFLRADFCFGAIGVLAPPKRNQATAVARWRHSPRRGAAVRRWDTRSTRDWVGPTRARCSRTAAGSAGRETSRTTSAETETLAYLLDDFVIRRNTCDRILCRTDKQSSRTVGKYKLAHHPSWMFLAWLRFPIIPFKNPRLR